MEGEEEELLGNLVLGFLPLFSVPHLTSSKVSRKLHLSFQIRDVVIKNHVNFITHHSEILP